jgi:hypothetical protein
MLEDRFFVVGVGDRGEANPLPLIGLVFSLSDPHPFDVVQYL